MCEFNLKSAKNKKSKTKIKVEVKEDWKTRISFNFSYLVSNKKYNHKSLEFKAHKKLLNKLYILSTTDFVTVKSWKKEEGFETLEIKKLKPPTDFTNSIRGEKAGKEYWVFRISTMGRVVCKRINTTFYIIAIDTTFDLYDH